MKTTYAWIWSVALSTLLAGAFQAQEQSTTAAPQQAGDGSDWVYLRPGSMVGKQLPSFELTSKDGATFSSDSLRGAPALIEFWATWCHGCIDSLPELAAFYNQTKCKGLALIALDQDEVEGPANDYLTKGHYEWPDYHESDEVRQSISPWAIPRTMLVNPSGKIVYDDNQFKPDALRSEFAKMGPRFESLASDQSTCPSSSKNTAPVGR